MIFAKAFEEIPAATRSGNELVMGKGRADLCDVVGTAEALELKTRRFDVHAVYNPFDFIIDYGSFLTLKSVDSPAGSVYIIRSVYFQDYWY